MLSCLSRSTFSRAVELAWLSERQRNSPLSKIGRSETDAIPKSDSGNFESTIDCELN